MLDGGIIMIADVKKTAEQKMKKSKASTAKGASESAPGGTTTGSAAKKQY